MVVATLALDATIAVATAALFAYVGSLVVRRPVEGAEARRALRLFGVWWFALATTTLLGASRSILAFMGNTDLALHATLANLGVVPLVALLWGLVYYLAYIYTGNARLFWPITLFHLGMLALFGWLVYARPATGVSVEAWNVPLTYATELDPRFTAVLILVILAPTIIGALAYGSLYFRTKDRTARYRIAMVSGAFLLWFGMAAVAAATPLSDWEWYPLMSRIDGLVATMMILAAFRPPRFVQLALGVEPVEMMPSSHPHDRLRLAVAAT